MRVVEPLVIVDTNIPLAHCLGPGMDAKADLAASAFHTLEGAGIRAYMTETLRDEFEAKVHERVGQVLDALLDLAQVPAPTLSGSGNPLDALEEMFATLRSKASGSAGALLLLETRVSAKIREQGQLTTDAWTNHLRTIGVEATLLLAEVQRRFDLLQVEVLPRPKGLDLERFRDLVDRADLEHIAACDSLAASKKRTVVFVTFDGKLHAARSEVGVRTSGRVVITSPVYLERQLKRQSSPTA